MEQDNHLSPQTANSQPIVNDPISFTPPNQNTPSIGQSVDYVHTSNSPLDASSSQHWFVIRATRGRARTIYETLSARTDFPFELYVPSYHREILKIVKGHPQKVINEGLYHNGFVFIRTSYLEFRKLVRAEAPYPFIDGLTPYYNHFQQSEMGRPPYLIVPDKQMQDFRTIIESQDDHILIDQDSMPTYLHGKKVEIIAGPFTGITGTLLRWKGLRRVFLKIDHIGTFATGFVRTCDFRLLS